MPYLSSSDRKIRKDAETAMWKFFENNNDEIEQIFDNLVKTRDKMAKKLGYENYIPLGYKRLGRTDYNENDVAKYREQILRDIVPLAEKIINSFTKMKKVFTFIILFSRLSYNIFFLSSLISDKSNCKSLPIVNCTCQQLYLAANLAILLKIPMLCLPKLVTIEVLSIGIKQE